MFESWQIEDLGPRFPTVDGASSGASYLHSVNDAGKVVGNMRVGTITRAFLIDSANTFVDFTPTDVVRCDAGRINAAGFIAGTLWFNSLGERRGYVRDPAGSISILKPLGSSPFPITVAHWISDNGAVTGWAYGGLEHAVQWGPPVPDAATTPVDVHGSEFQRSYGTAINDSGQIAGAAIRGSGIPIKYVLRDAGAWQEISTIEPWVSWPQAGLSAGGVVLGTGTKTPWSPIAFVYEGGAVTPLDLAPTPMTSAGGISASGEVVGSTWKSGLTALSWQRSSGIENLNHRLPAFSGWELKQAHAISPSGAVIVGYGVLNGQERFFRLRRVLDLPYYPPVTMPDIPHEWASWILTGGRLDNEGIRLGPNGPIPVPPWVARADEGGRREFSEILRLLALADLSGQLSDPELRRKTQSPLFQQALERLKVVAKAVSTRVEFQEVKWLSAPSPITGRVPRVTSQPSLKRAKGRPKK